MLWHSDITQLKPTVESTPVVFTHCSAHSAEHSKSYFNTSVNQHCKSSFNSPGIKHAGLEWFSTVGVHESHWVFTVISLSTCSLNTLRNNLARGVNSCSLDTSN